MIFLLFLLRLLLLLPYHWQSTQNIKNIKYYCVVIPISVSENFLLANMSICWFYHWLNLPPNNIQYWNIKIFIIFTTVDVEENTNIWYLMLTKATPTQPTKFQRSPSLVSPPGQVVVRRGKLKWKILIKCDIKICRDMLSVRRTLHKDEYSIIKRL